MGGRRGYHTPGHNGLHSIFGQFSWSLVSLLCVQASLTFCYDCTGKRNDQSGLITDNAHLSIIARAGLCLIHSFLLGEFYAQVQELAKY